MVSSTTPILRTHVVWTVYGVCTSGSIAPQRDATRKRDPGGAVTTSTRPERSHRRRWCQHHDKDSPVFSECPADLDHRPGGIPPARRRDALLNGSERVSQRAFLGVAALLFAASVTLTIVWCTSMSEMGEMPMP